MNINFIDTGLDERILKSLPLEELVKAMKREGLVQKEVQVRLKSGKIITRKQWVKAGEGKKTQPTKKNDKPSEDKKTSDVNTEKFKPSDFGFRHGGQETADLINELDRAVGVKDISNGSPGYGHAFLENGDSVRFEYNESVRPLKPQLVWQGQIFSNVKELTDKWGITKKASQKPQTSAGSSGNDGGNNSSNSKKLSYYKASDATKQKVMKATEGMNGDAVVKMCKDKGIEWKEHSHKGINNMRAKMALAKYFDDGGK